MSAARERARIPTGADGCRPQRGPAPRHAEPNAAFDVRRVREDFPALHQTVHGQPLAYLDNAATALKPRCVIEAVAGYYGRDCANIHRGIHTVSERATAAYEAARVTVQRFLNAPESREVVFTRGATESINLVAHAYGRVHVGAGDEVLITAMEHHSNLVPWQMLCEERGARLVVAPIDDSGELVLDAFERLVSPRTRLVSVAQVSNALGTINPVRRIVDLAHGRGVPVMVDGAQAAPHLPIDVRTLGCDFYTFSGHKVFGPTGIGVLWARAEQLEAMPPFLGGGDMILSVTFEKTTYNKIPYKFEAGTPPIAEAIGLGAAIDYVTGIGLPAIEAYERDLTAYGARALAAIPGVRLVGTARDKSSVLSFTLDGVHPHDIGTVLDHEGVAIRAGHHCAQPVMARFGVPATARASLAFYNTAEEVDRLVAGVHAAREVFGA